MVTRQTSHMKALKHSTLIGVAYTLPLLIWSLLQLSVAIGYGEALNTLQESTSITIIVQEIIISLYIPRLPSNTALKSIFPAILILIAMPWPFFALAWLTDAININTICFSQGSIITYALLLITAAKALSHFNFQNTHHNLACSLLQLAAINGVILFSPKWIMEIGL